MSNFSIPNFSKLNAIQNNDNFISFLSTYLPTVTSSSALKRLTPRSVQGTQGATIKFLIIMNQEIHCFMNFKQEYII